MSDSGTVRILGIAGSLRLGSFNVATLRAAQELAPAGMTQSNDAAAGYQQDTIPPSRSAQP